MNKSCFKDCFYSFSHEHTRGYTHLFFLIPRPRPPFSLLPPSNPASRFRWALLEFRVEFCYFEFELFFFVSIFGFVSRSTPTFSSIFFFIFSSFRFLSICSTRTVPPPGPPSNSVETYQFLLQLGRQCSVPIMTRKVTNTRSNSFLPGSSYMCVSVFKRGGTAAAERSRFFKYDIKKQKRKKNSYLLVHKWRKTRKLLIFRRKNKTTISCNKTTTTTTVRSWTKSKRLK